MFQVYFKFLNISCLNRRLFEGLAQCVSGKSLITCRPSDATSSSDLGREWGKVCFSFVLLPDVTCLLDQNANNKKEYLYQMKHSNKSELYPLIYDVYEKIIDKIKRQLGNKKNITAD